MPALIDWDALHIEPCIRLVRTRDSATTALGLPFMTGQACKHGHERLGLYDGEALGENVQVPWGLLGVRSGGRATHATQVCPIQGFWRIACHGHTYQATEFHGGPKHLPRITLDSQALAVRHMANPTTVRRLHTECQNLCHDIWQESAKAL